MQSDLAKFTAMSSLHRIGCALVCAFMRPLGLITAVKAAADVWWGRLPPAAALHS